MWSAVAFVCAACYASLLGFALHVRATPAAAIPAAEMIVPHHLLSAMEHAWESGLLRMTPVAALPVYGGTAEVVAWAPHGQSLAVGYSGGTLLIWDTLRQRPQHLIGMAHQRFISALAWSPSGNRVISAAADGTAVLWRIGSGWTQTTALWRHKASLIGSKRFLMPHY